MSYKKPVSVFSYSVKTPCDTYGCRNRATWGIGRPDGPPTTHYHLCDHCIQQMIQSLPGNFENFGQTAAQGVDNGKANLDIKDVLAEASTQDVLAILKDREGFVEELASFMETEMGITAEDNEEDEINEDDEAVNEVSNDAGQTAQDEEFTAESLKEKTVAELLKIAKELDVDGRHDMNKAELIDAILKTKAMSK